MTAITKDLQSHWARIGPMLSIRNERDYDLAVKRLNELVDEIGTDERHPETEIDLSRTRVTIGGFRSTILRVRSVS